MLECFVLLLFSLYLFVESLVYSVFMCTHMFAYNYYYVLLCIIFIVSNPDVTMEPVMVTLNEPLGLLCEGITPRGVTSRVDIEWERIDDDSDQILQTRMGVNSSTRGNMLVFTDNYTTTARLNQSDNGAQYLCTIVTLIRPCSSRVIICKY